MPGTSALRNYFTPNTRFHINKILQCKVSQLHVLFLLQSASSITRYTLNSSNQVQDTCKREHKTMTKTCINRNFGANIYAQHPYPVLEDCARIIRIFRPFMGKQEIYCKLCEIGLNLLTLNSSNINITDFALVVPLCYGNIYIFVNAQYNVRFRFPLRSSLTLYHSFYINYI